MSSISNLIISLATAKRLKELGLVAPSFFCYCGDEFKDTYWEPYTTDEAAASCGAGWYHARLRAYSLQELMHFFPKNVRISVSMSSQDWKIMATCGTMCKGNASETQCDTMAQLLIDCINEKMFSVTDALEHYNNLCEA